MSMEMAIVLKLCSLFLLLQIIAGTEDYCPSLSRTQPCKPSRYRTIDGSCNNLKNPSWGKAYWPYRRLAPSAYSDGKHSLPTQKSGKPYPSARVVSNLLFKPGNMHSQQYTLIHMQMGQIITHDMALAEGTQAFDANVPPPGCCGLDNMYGTASNTSKCSDIDIPPKDPDYSEVGYQCLPFARTTTTKKYCSLYKKPEEQITTVTSYLDMSVIYGSSDQSMRRVRLFKDGKLKSVTRNGQLWPPNVSNPQLVCVGSNKSDALCYEGGDLRFNQHPQLTTLEVLFFRQHEKIVVALKALNPHWKDEKLFQETRIILIAIYQHIVFNEILPGHLGLANMIKNGLLYPNATGCVDDYNPKADATTINEFVSSAWRKFHSEVAGLVLAYNKKREVSGKVRLVEWIDGSSILELNDDVDYNTMLRGMTIQNAYESDPFYTHDLKCRFAKDKKTDLGLDLVSIDIQRARDHGLMKYCEARNYFNMPCPKTFEELSPIIPETEVQKLKILYESMPDLELHVASLLEKNVEGSLAGPTFQYLMLKQFKQTRTGDRYFYENCSSKSLTTEQLQSIRTITLARVICDNSDIDQCQAKVTELPSDSNPVVNCSTLPSLDITLWKSEERCDENSSSPDTY